MDSLVTSAIALAAGGWNKVKLVGIYSDVKTSIPTWKLGICSLHTPNRVTSNGISVSSLSSVLVGPGSVIIIYTPTSGEMIGFQSSSITTNDSTNIKFTAVLFTWD